MIVEEYLNVKKVCSFYVNTVHLVAMIFPYINKELKTNAKFNNFLEHDLKNDVEKIAEKIMKKNNWIKNILKLNWERRENIKYGEIEKQLKEEINNYNKLIIFIMGSRTYIENVNKNIEKCFLKNIKKIQGKNINIINCYEVGEFNENIKEILDAHSAVLNTAGIHEIAQVFKGYKKAN